MLGAILLTHTCSPQLTQWLDGEGAARLREMGAEECSPDSCERFTERWSQFLLQAAVRTAASGVTSQHAAQLWAQTSACKIRAGLRCPYRVWCTQPSSGWQRDLCAKCVSSSQGPAVAPSSAALGLLPRQSGPLISRSAQGRSNTDPLRAAQSEWCKARPRRAEMCRTPNALLPLGVH